MKNLFLIAIVAIGFAACSEKGEHHHHVTPAMIDSMRNDLLKTDLAFSKLSEEKGQNTAFFEYASDNATVLRPFSRPVTGRDSLKHMLSIHPDSTFVLTWVPISSDVARSGEIGFTYGTYSLEFKAGGHEEGTYCTVWHKDSTKAWKFILDTGNEGLSPKEKAEDTKLDAKTKGGENNK